MFHFDKKIFQKKRNTSVRTENRTELFRKILSQEEIDLIELENLCFEGIPEDNAIKATCWKILLGYLPLNTTEWKSHLQQQRNLYEFYINLLFQNPETYNNGQPYNTTTTTSTTPATDPTSRPYSARPASQSNFSDYVKHTATIIQPKQNTYFQDENTPKPVKKPAKKASLFFEDSDDERIKPKPGLFDSDVDNDNNSDDILGIQNNNQQNDEQKHDIMSDGDGAETPVPKEVEQVFKMDGNNNKKGSKQNGEFMWNIDENKEVETDIKNQSSGMSNVTESQEIVFMTPTNSLKSNNEIPKDILNDPLLKDLPNGGNVNVNDQNDDPLGLGSGNNKKNNGGGFDESDGKTPKIFSDTSTGFSTDTSTPQNSKHQKKDSKILINGQDINDVNNSKSRKKSDNIKPLDFKPTDHPDPLSKQPNNPWKTYFDDWEIWNRIKKDIHRTHQTYAFFRSNHMICEDSMSKNYRFPFDIASEPPPMTPSISMPNNNNNNFPIIKLDKQESKHRKMDSAPILNVPNKKPVSKHKGSNSASDTYDDSMTSSGDEEHTITHIDDNNSDDNNS
eukprot:316424_1